jgi:hypothetical protein
MQRLLALNLLQRIHENWIRKERLPPPLPELTSARYECQYLWLTLDSGIEATPSCRIFQGQSAYLLWS